MTYLKGALALLCLVPFAYLIQGAIFGSLGANPIETITRSLGDWALRLLLLTLAITPIRRLFGWNSVMRLRRMLGLFSFFYATLHLFAYIVLDQFFHWPAIWADILKRPYITIGMLTFTLLVPLAVTSSHGMMRRLGGRRWQRIHRLIYPAAVGAVLHYYWLVKADTREPLVYAAVLLLLLGLRIHWFRHIVQRALSPAMACLRRTRVHESTR